MLLQIRDIYNLSIHADSDPQNILTDNFKIPISCLSHEILYICINKVMLPRHIINYENEKSYIPIRVPQAYSKIKVSKDTNFEIDKYGPVIYEYSGHDDFVHDIQYYPLIGKEISTINFFLDLSNVHTIYETIDINSGIAIKCPVAIQYTIIKVLADYNMDRLIHKSIIVDNQSNILTYPENIANNFRCNLQTPLDTSHSTGQPYAQLNSITIPASVNFTTILQDALISVIAIFEPEGGTSQLFESTAFKFSFDQTKTPVKSRSDIVSNDDGSLTTRVVMTIPLFFPDDDAIIIQGSFNFRKQIEKRLAPLKITFEEYNSKIKMVNNGAADKISIKFSPPSLAAAIGHVHKEVNPDDYNIVLINAKKKKPNDEEETLEDDEENYDSAEDGENQQALPKTKNRRVIHPLESDNDTENEEELEAQESDISDLEDQPAADSNTEFVRAVDFEDDSYGALTFDIFRLAPSALYVYANFIDETYVHGKQKRLLAVLDTTTAYDDNRKRNIKHLLLPLYNKRPMIAHINSDTIQHMQFSLETSDGNPYPFLNDIESNICRINLSFRYK